MAKRKLVYSILEDTFCTYCQREFKTPKRLQTHLQEKHVGTYAHHAMLEAQTAQRIDPGVALAQKEKCLVHYWQSEPCPLCKVG